MLHAFPCALLNGQLAVGCLVAVMVVTNDQRTFLRNERRIGAAQQT
jgi:hypothetical protein